MGKKPDDLTKARIAKTQKEGSGSIWKPVDALYHAIDLIESGELEPTKLFIVMCDDSLSSHDGDFFLKWLQSGSHVGEMITMTEALKRDLLIRLMGE